jgi:hypothetical protein
MFRIHKAQMDFFAEKERARYLGRLRAFLESEFPDCFDEMESEDIDAWVEEAVGVCDRYGVTTERDATQLVMLLLVLGTDADLAHAWAGETLADPELLPEGKVRRLLVQAREAGIEGVDDVDLGEPLEAS